MGSSTTRRRAPQPGAAAAAAPGPKSAILAAPSDENVQHNPVRGRRPPRPRGGRGQRGAHKPASAKQPLGQEASESSVLRSLPSLESSASADSLAETLGGRQPLGGAQWAAVLRECLVVTRLVPGPAPAGSKAATQEAAEAGSGTVCKDDTDLLAECLCVVSAASAHQAAPTSHSMADAAAAAPALAGPPTTLRHVCQLAGTEEDGLLVPIHTLHEEPAAQQAQSQVEAAALHNSPSSSTDLGTPAAGGDESLACCSDAGEGPAREPGTAAALQPGGPATMDASTAGPSGAAEGCGISGHQSSTLEHEAVQAAAIPRPILVFGGPHTLHARLLDWEWELTMCNQLQAQLRLVSGSSHVPLFPRCPVARRLLMRAGLYPQTLVSGAARFQEVLEGAPPLQAAAAECGLWQWGQVAVVGSGGGGGLQVVGYAPEAMCLANATPRLLSCYVACTFHEANRQDSGPAYATYTVTLEGILPAPRAPRYSLTDLAEWLGIALGREGVGLAEAREAALLAAPACARVEGAVIVVE